MAFARPSAPASLPPACVHPLVAALVVVVLLLTSPLAPAKSPTGSGSESEYVIAKAITCASQGCDMLPKKNETFRIYTLASDSLTLPLNFSWRCAGDASAGKDSAPKSLPSAAEIEDSSAKDMPKLVVEKVGGGETLGDVNNIVSYTPLTLDINDFPDYSSSATNVTVTRNPDYLGLSISCTWMLDTFHGCKLDNPLMRAYTIVWTNSSSAAKSSSDFARQASGSTSLRAALGVTWWAWWGTTTALAALCAPLLAALRMPTF
ncbi:hypothetical protein CBR_g40630 [Chara braunii]|uniref:Uncharacterized protein n=1 Tax=Chara braunii TaxID=69332 RepID=A0A388LU28_CHABU|nr:hypothetical protein CBR_g40630 [Chara braunii]|eukprot:GBG85820.1 hypothetical protein CBR_g40630 [Chara braunii]